MSGSSRGRRVNVWSQRGLTGLGPRAATAPRSLTGPVHADVVRAAVRRHSQPAAVELPLVDHPSRTPAACSGGEAVVCGCHCVGSMSWSHSSALSRSPVPGMRVVKPTSPWARRQRSPARSATSRSWTARRPWRGGGGSSEEGLAPRGRSISAGAPEPSIQEHDVRLGVGRKSPVGAGPGRAAERVRAAAGTEVAERAHAITPARRVLHAHPRVSADRRRRTTAARPPRRGRRRPRPTAKSSEEGCRCSRGRLTAESSHPAGSRSTRRHPADGEHGLR